MDLKMKYGKTALVAGASEGLGAAFATYLAANGIDLVLIARRIAPLKLFATHLENTYKVNVICIACDLADSNAMKQITQVINPNEIKILVYNAAIAYIGAFENNTAENHEQMAQANMIAPINMLHVFGNEMLRQKKGAVIIMASLAGFQGSGYLSIYAATKAFCRVLAESLWYEWKDKGVDVIACCAGATSTPNYIKSKPEKASFFAPKVQTPEEVVKECFKKLGTTPSFVSGSGNKFASFIMQKLMPRKMAVTIMGNTTRKMYRL